MLEAADPHAIALTAIALPEEARGYVIEDDASYHRAVEFARGCKALRVEIGSTLDPHIRRADQAHKALVKEKRDAEADAVLAERIIKDAIVAWEVHAEALRESERRDLERVARDVAGDIVLDRAIAATLDGDHTTAEAILDEPLHVPVAAVPTHARPTGVALRETWKARVTNLGALVKHAASNPMFVAMLLPNQKALDAQAKSFQGRLQIPGVEAVCTKDAAIRVTP